MTFGELLDRVIAMLERRGRITTADSRAPATGGGVGPDHPTPDSLPPTFPR
jgi:hypothetical protein